MRHPIDFIIPWHSSAAVEPEEPRRAADGDIPLRRKPQTETTIRRTPRDAEITLRRKPG